jgi:outer membrane murein-binding lipoprotein Lpp
MTKRELFAALAMQAILAGCYTNPKAEEIPSEWLSAQALEHADALIDALNKEGE